MLAPQLHIILVRPQQQGNVGAAARAMANMGLEHLVIVEPAVDLGSTAYAFAVGAGKVLDEHRRVASLTEALAPYRRAVGTTSRRAREIGAEVPLLSPRELPAALAEDPPDTPTALVFGPEASGLTAAELALLSPWVSIPCAPEQPTLNLSQAVLVVTYELYLARRDAAGTDPGTPPEAPVLAARGDLDGLLEHVAATLQQVGFARDDSFPQVLEDLTQLAARAALTEREVRVLRGICRRTLRALERQDLEQGLEPSDAGQVEEAPTESPRNLNMDSRKDDNT
jgi:TrmH family RNA methyltransferase